ncbi:MAG: hypothetical protein M3389_00610 [Actinomycetota bacterium]|nr:hypothetical protein [Actinomycetota bacterium]
MAELTPLDEKLAEVLGLAQAAQDTVAKVAKMEGADAFSSDLDRMTSESEETQRRTMEIVDGLEGKKTAITDKARETKQEAAEMRDAYLEGEEEALDGFEFLTMAEAGELGHWEIVETIAETAGEARIRELASWAVGVQRGHFEGVRQAALQLAKEEARELASA